MKTFETVKKPAGTVLLLIVAVLVSIAPADASHFSKGQRYFFKGDYQKALKAFEQALQKNDQNPMLWYLAGKSQLELGQTKQARRSLQKALILKADYGLARLALARLCHRELDEACARANYEYLVKHQARELSKQDLEVLAELRETSSAPAVVAKTDQAAPNPLPTATATAQPAVVAVSKDTRPPKIVLLAPALSRGIHVIGSDPGADPARIQIAGIATDDSRVKRITINGQEIAFRNQGQFEARVSISPGQNVINIRAVDSYGNVALKQITVQRPVKVAKVTPPPLASVPETTRGYRYFALIIAVADYADPAISDLDAPLDDARRLEHLLTGQYTFDPKRILLLTNPTRSRIVNTFYGLSKTIGAQDNLLIFYAGHGYWDQDLGIGYWLPQNAHKNDRADWLSNTTIRDYIRGIKSRHTLLIADACFSGGIFKTRSAFAEASPSVSELYKLNSRKAMTSGTLTEVPDQSVFVNYLLKRLQQNRSPYLSAGDLFAAFRTAVINNSPTHQIPQFGTIHGCGDEGGDFIFARRQP